MDADLIEKIAAETSDNQEQRLQLKHKLDTLRKGMETLKRHVARGETVIDQGEDESQSECESATDPTPVTSERSEPPEVMPITPVSPDVTEQVPRTFVDMSSTSLRSVGTEEAGPSRVPTRVARRSNLWSCDAVSGGHLEKLAELLKELCTTSSCMRLEIHHMFHSGTSYMSPSNDHLP
ncbi:MAG: hypothetical protein M1840_005778 [Geoglossum simile]|nr:MAG: hypothetical protein M1840_005778 [Geoglossum simile]